MLPDNTTTIGLLLLVATDRPFQSMKAVLRTKAKFRTCAASCRGCMLPKAENIVAVCGVGIGWLVGVDWWVWDWVIERVGAGALGPRERSWEKVASVSRFLQVGVARISYLSSVVD